MDLEELDVAVSNGSVDTVLLALTDMQGRLQGKRLHGRYFMDEVVDGGSEGCNYLLAVDVEEKSTGELQLTGGYSSLERFVLQLSVAQRNFRGMGQELNAGVNYSRYSRSVQLGFVEPYLFD